MIKQKHIIGILLALVMICAALSVVDTVSAAKYKKIDSGKFKNDDGTMSRFTTYYNSKTVKINMKIYAKNPKTKKYQSIGTTNIYLTKSSKKTLKVKVVLQIKWKAYSSTNTGTYYEKTSLSAKSYYIKKLKPAMK